ncbi:MAG: hypothetical protein HYZ81_25105 [Nitrospinae bacterium]|nr:hypothetical protein [Nitrospinota bacterium]
MSEVWMVAGAWVAAWLTLCLFSFLYRDNPFYKLAEHLYIGVTVGYSLAITYYKSFLPKVVIPLFVEHNLLILIPAILGLLTLTRLMPRLSWLSRISFAFLIGYGAGLAIPLTIASLLLKQIEGTVLPLITVEDQRMTTSLAGLLGDLNSLLIIVGVLTVLMYFFFSIPHTGPLRAISRIGIYFLMVYFGASFGATVMGRFSLLYGRLFDLYTFRTGRYFYATPLLLALLILSLLAMALAERKRRPTGGG